MLILVDTIMQLIDAGYVFHWLKEETPWAKLSDLHETKVSNSSFAIRFHFLPTWFVCWRFISILTYRGWYYSLIRKIRMESIFTGKKKYVFVFILRLKVWTVACQEIFLPSLVSECEFHTLSGVLFYFWVFIFLMVWKLLLRSEILYCGHETAVI